MSDHAKNQGCAQQFNPLYARIAILSYALISASCTPDDGRATVRFERVSRFGAMLSSVDVFANGVKIGSAENGEKKNFIFYPVEGQETIFHAELIVPFTTPKASNSVTIKAKPGSTVYCQADTNASGKDGTPAWLALRATLEKQGSGTTGKQKGVDSLTSDQKPPWDAISSIGTVVGVFISAAAIVVSFKQSRR